MKQIRYKRVIDYKQSLFNQFEHIYWGIDNYLINLDKFKHIDPILLLAQMHNIIKRHLPYIKVKSEIVKIKPIKTKGAK
jgi:hypothetical protein